MTPYVICQGDFLAKLAHRFGFDADEVWNDPANESLRDVRKDHNILAPTDVLYIPDDAGTNLPVHNLAIGQTNTFVSDPPMVTIAVKFANKDSSSHASKAFTIQELDHLTDLTTTGDGVASFQAPVTLKTATLTFTESGEIWKLCIGTLDPVNTISGIFQRLQNLGYIPASAQVNGDDRTQLHRGLYYFRSQQTPPPGDSSTDDNSGDDSGADDSTGTDGSDVGDSDDGDDSVNLSFADDVWCFDGCGLSDSGALEPELEASLLTEHGG
ncbi:MAG: hypothetical protein ABTD50_06640 [Polyangiaceae bacterium]|jgi:hypothetical protein